MLCIEKLRCFSINYLGNFAIIVATNGVLAPQRRDGSRPGPVGNRERSDHIFPSHVGAKIKFWQDRKTQAGRAHLAQAIEACTFIIA